MIVPQPRSGYFVAPRKAQPPVPPMSRPVQRPVEITQWDQVLTMLDARYDKSIILRRRLAGRDAAKPEAHLA